MKRVDDCPLHNKNTHVLHKKTVLFLHKIKLYKKNAFLCKKAIYRPAQEKDILLAQEHGNYVLVHEGHSCLVLDKCLFHEKKKKKKTSFL